MGDQMRRQLSDVESPEINGEVHSIGFIVEVKINLS